MCGAVVAPPIRRHKNAEGRAEFIDSRIAGNRTLLRELEPDIVLTATATAAPHASGVDEICTPFGERRRWQHSVALDGSITLHLVPHHAALGGRI